MSVGKPQVKMIRCRKPQTITATPMAICLKALLAFRDVIAASRDEEYDFVESLEKRLAEPPST